MNPAVVGAPSIGARAPIQSITDLALLLVDMLACFDKGSATDEEKSKIISALNFNFERLKQDPSLMSTALLTYGRFIYGQNYTLAAITLRLSLEWQIEKSTRFSFYTSFADMVREPFDFEKIDQLLEKVEKPDMMLIHTLKWYAFACMNSKEVGNALHLQRFENLYAKIKTFCAALNTKDSIWEIGQIIYNSRPLCNWKKPGDIEAQLEWIKGAEYSLTLEGNTLRARTFQAQMLSMEAKLLDSIPTNEIIFKKKLELARRAHKTAQENPDFDPFLKLKFINDLATMLSEAFMVKREGISKDEIVSLFKQLVQEVYAIQNYHEYHAQYLKNAAHFESACGNFKESVLHYQKAAEIAGKCFKIDDAARHYRSAAFIANDYLHNPLLAKELFQKASTIESPFV